jgi:hypothetical protein
MLKDVPSVIRVLGEADDELEASRTYMDYVRGPYREPTLEYAITKWRSDYEVSHANAMPSFYCSCLADCKSVFAGSLFRPLPEAVICQMRLKLLWML